MKICILFDLVAIKHFILALSRPNNPLYYVYKIVVGHQSLSVYQDILRLSYASIIV